MCIRVDLSEWFIGEDLREASQQMVGKPIVLWHEQKVVGKVDHVSVQGDHLVVHACLEGGCSLYEGYILCPVHSPETRDITILALYDLDDEPLFDALESGAQ